MLVSLFFHPFYDSTVPVGFRGHGKRCFNKELINKRSIGRICILLAALCVKKTIYELLVLKNAPALITSVCTVGNVGVVGLVFKTERMNYENKLCGWNLFVLVFLTPVMEISLRNKTGFS